MVMRIEEKVTKTVTVFHEGLNTATDRSKDNKTTINTGNGVTHDLPPAGDRTADDFSSHSGFRGDRAKRAKEAASLLFIAFGWDDSQEGYDYWNDVVERLNAIAKAAAV